MHDIRLVDIDKAYPFSRSLANRKARLDIAAGEIHAIVGENGAGKTTLMKILSGMYKPDSGSILIDGEPVQFSSPAGAAAHGIRMVHQHFTIIPGFSAAENIVFGSEPVGLGFFTNPKNIIKEAKAVVDRYGFAIDPTKPASELTVGERQQVEILRQLHRNCEVLILDEPTAVLTEQEILAFFKTLNSLKQMGRTIIVITHKVREVMEISDRVTVMRDGVTLGDFDTRTITENEISDLVIGKASNQSVQHPNTAGTLLDFQKAEPVLVLDRVSLARKHKGSALLDSLSLTINSGEIHGLCAVSGNGLAEIENILAGFDHPTSGKILYRNRPYPQSRKAPGKAEGIGYVPSDRMKRGASLFNTLWENSIAVDRDGFFPHGILNKPLAKKQAMHAIESFSIKAEPESFVQELSGGNIQKLILSRELIDPPPAFCLLCEPTWGLDIATTEFIYKKILETKAKGCAILLISSNLDEILSLSDRISVLSRGALVDTVQNSSNITRGLLGSMMLGISNSPGTRKADLKT
jgi:simple sugar transport system ATP-binding protein